MQEAAFFWCAFALLKDLGPGFTAFLNCAMRNAKNNHVDASKGDFLNS